MEASSKPPRVRVRLELRTRLSLCSRWKKLAVGHHCSDQKGGLVSPTKDI